MFTHKHIRLLRRGGTGHDEFSHCYFRLNQASAQLGCSIFTESQSATDDSMHSITRTITSTESTLSNYLLSTQHQWLLKFDTTAGMYFQINPMVFLAWPYSDLRFSAKLQTQEILHFLGLLKSFSLWNCTSGQKNLGYNNKKATS